MPQVIIRNALYQQLHLQILDYHGWEHNPLGCDLREDKFVQLCTKCINPAHAAACHYNSRIYTTTT